MQIPNGYQEILPTHVPTEKVDCRYCKNILFLGGHSNSTWIHIWTLCLYRYITPFPLETHITCTKVPHNNNITLKKKYSKYIETYIKINWILKVLVTVNMNLRLHTTCLMHFHMLCLPFFKCLRFSYQSKHLTNMVNIN